MSKSMNQCRSVTCIHPGLDSKPDQIQPYTTTAGDYVGIEKMIKERD